MEKINFTSHTTCDENGEETRTNRYVFALTKADGFLSQQNAWKTLNHVVKSGLIQPYGCDCYHCRNDWDCCGNFVVGSNRLFFAGDRMIVLQRLSRNL